MDELQIPMSKPLSSNWVTAAASNLSLILFLPHSPPPWPYVMSPPCSVSSSEWEESRPLGTTDLPSCPASSLSPCSLALCSRSSFLLSLEGHSASWLASLIHSHPSGKRWAQQLNLHAPFSFISFFCFLHHTYLYPRSHLLTICCLPPAAT